MASKIETVCTKNNVAYIDVRKAMMDGARTLDELKEKANVCGECDSCKEYIPHILESLCGCKEVSMKTVQDLVKSGVNSLDEIMEITGAGTGEDCGKCQGLIQNIIDQGY